jgi:hypothetical protein
MFTLAVVAIVCACLIGFTVAVERSQQPMLPKATVRRLPR